MEDPDPIKSREEILKRKNEELNKAFDNPPAPLMNQEPDLSPTRHRVSLFNDAF